MEADKIQLPGITCNEPDKQETLTKSISNVKCNKPKFILLQDGNPQLIFHDVQINEMSEITGLAEVILYQAEIATAENSIFRIVRTVKNYQDKCGMHPLSPEPYHCDIIIECDQGIFDAFMKKRDSLRRRYKIFQAIDMVSCSNCHFLYRAKDHRMPIICYWCTGDHTPQDCTVTDPRCQNCGY